MSSVINDMESISKITTSCDNCRTSLGPDEKEEQIKATLKGPDGKDKDFHLCSEECLRQHLNSRVKKKSSKASLEIDLFEK